MAIDDALGRLKSGLDEDERIARAAGNSLHVHDLDVDRPGCDDPRCVHDRRQKPKATLDRVEAIRRVIAVAERRIREADIRDQVDRDGEQILSALASIYPDLTEGS